MTCAMKHVLLGAVSALTLAAVWGIVGKATYTLATLL